MTNSRTWKIAVGILLFSYILSPVDIMSDGIPVIGWLDDIVAAIMLAKNIAGMFPVKHSVEEIPAAEVVKH